jgi:hypothetical protein
MKGGSMHPGFLETTTGGRVFFWNVDGTVGLNGVNNFDDVMFVQWCIYKSSTWPGIDQAAAIAGYATDAHSFRESLRKVPISGSCSGDESDETVEKIKFLQALTTGPMDGRVSPIHQSVRYTDGSGVRHIYLIFWLNQILKDLHPREFPRLDLMLPFVWRISNKVKPVFWEK